MTVSKITLFLSMWVFFLCTDTGLCTPAHIVFKSGRQMDTEIIESTDSYVRVEYQGNSLYYEKKYIRSIEYQKEAQVPAAVETVQEPRLQQDKTITGIEISDKEANYSLFLAINSALEGNFEQAEAVLAQGLQLHLDAAERINGVISLLDEVKSGVTGKEYAQSFLTGTKYLLQKQYQDAIDWFKKALELKPADTDILYNMACANFSLNDYPQVVTCLNQSLKIEPSDPDAIGMLGMAYYRLEKYKEARQCYSLARELFYKRQDTLRARQIEEEFAGLPILADS